MRVGRQPVPVAPPPPPEFTYSIEALSGRDLRMIRTAITRAKFVDVLLDPSIELLRLIDEVLAVAPQTSSTADLP